MPKAFVISLGGSLIVPKDGISTAFLKKFRQLILDRIHEGDKFFIISGGGTTCRQYIQAADKIIKVSDEDKDWLGIHSTRLNAHLLRTIFFDVAHPEIIKNPTYRMPTSKPVIIAGGWKPGWSTDYVATLIAQEYAVDSIINLSNIDYVYDRDPKKHHEAKPIKLISWKDFRQLVGSVWSPGLNMPFDPIASKKAEELNLKVIITGANIPNLNNIFFGKKYRGTLVNN